ncbi:MAG: hypothetical protein ACYCST_22045, partial [Acidimicrobiales bacterium]
MQNEDLIPSEASEQIGLDRYYNSLAPASQSKGLGPRWSWGVGPDVYLAISGETVALHGPSGYVVTLHQRAGGTYAAPEEFEGKLVKNENGTYTLSETEGGVTYQFNSTGVMTSYSTEEGKSFTVANTTISGESLLHTITPSSGKALEVDYNSTPHAVEVKTPDGKIRKYAYNSQSELVSFTNPTNERTEYEYTNGYLSKIKTPNGTIETITYNTTAVGRVSEVSISKTGEATHGYKFTYQAPAEPTCTPATDAGETTVTETPAKEGTEPETYCYDALGQITRYPPEVNPEEEPQEQTPFEGQTEGTETACAGEAGVSAEECAPYTEEAGEATATYSPSVAIAQGHSPLTPQDYGIADGQLTTATFNPFSKPSFTELEVKYLRLFVPWNLVYEVVVTKNSGYDAQLAELERKLKQFNADNRAGIVLFSMEHCEKPSSEVEAEEAKEVAEGKRVERNTYWYNAEGKPESCDKVPSPPKYHEDMSTLLEHLASFEKVEYFTPWNEPSNPKKGSNHTLPETGKPAAVTAGNYWR